MREEGRSRSSRLALAVEQILDADDRAVEWPEREARLCAGVGGIRRNARGLGVDRETGARTLPARIGNPRKRRLQAVAGCSHLDPGYRDRGTPAWSARRLAGRCALP